MKNVRNLSATEAHAIRIEEAKHLLSRILNKLTVEELLDRTPDWGHVGSLSHTVEQLEEITSFLNA